MFEEGLSGFTEKIAGEDCGRVLLTKPPKEQGPKIPLGTNLSGRRTTVGRNSGERDLKDAAKGENSGRYVDREGNRRPFLSFFR